jgi:hypothetical protein
MPSAESRKDSGYSVKVRLKFSGQSPDGKFPARPNPSSLKLRDWLGLADGGAAVGW